MRRKKNITLNLQNTTPHFTGKEKIITLGSIIIMLSFANIALSLSNIFYNSNVSALSYQGSADVKFTFNPTLSINISPSDLIIDNLTPGTNNNSNVINVSVATNASHGYTLSATVGDSLHNNSDLVHTNSTNVFSSITADSSLPSLTTDNTWGYSYKLSNTTNWNNYSGLSNKTSKTLVNTDNQLAKPIDFKIAAKASSTQPSGTYTNTINFIAISKPIPKTIEDIAYMQTFGELVETDLQSVKDSMTLNQDYALKDSRDEKEYYITKLADGHIWMTQNLDFDIDTTRTYTHNDTDLGWDPNSFDINATWKPDTTNGRYNLPVNGTYVPGWSNQNNYPYSADPGDVYYYTSNSEANDIKYNSLSECIAANHTEGNCKHYHAGNYYNWTAAIASNNSSNLTTQYTNAPNSICPKGWRLPIATNADQSVYEFGDLLYVYYNITTKRANDLSVPYATGGFNKIRSSPLWFARSGSVSSGGVLKYTGGRGNYWSSVVHGASGTLDLAYFLLFDENAVYPAYYSGARYGGWSVRCVIR